MRAPLRPVSPAVLVTALLLAITPAAALAATAGGDPLRQRQWHLDAVSAPQAWAASRGQGVTVAVVDTGVDLDHPDLAGQVRSGYDATDPGSPAEDENGHGTLVAGVIAALAGNDEGGAGVAPQASILPVRVLDEQGRGRPSEIADGIRWATQHGAEVINLSFVEVPGATDGLLDEVGLLDERVEEAIRDAHDAGVVVVGAAGNDGDDQVPYARDLPLTVVGASDRDGARWGRSNAGPDTVFAPGVDVVSTWTRGRYAQTSGTSFAAPIVAGGAALLLDLGLPPGEVRRVLGEHSRRTSDAGVAIVDLAAAVSATGARVAESPPSSGSGDGPGGGEQPTSRTASAAPPEPAGASGPGGEDAGAPGGGAAPGGAPEEAPPGGVTPDADGGASASEDDAAGASASPPQRSAPPERPAPGDPPAAAPPGDGVEEIEPVAEEREVAGGQLSVSDAAGPPTVALVAAWTLLGVVGAGHAGRWWWRRSGG